MEYERCPHTQSFPYIKATNDQASCEAAQRGFDIHKQCADYLLSPKTAEIPNFSGVDFPALAASNPISEKKYGLTPTWEECDYKGAWLKVIPDALIVTPESITIIDFKTGKREYKEIKHAQQMQLYACAMDAVYPSRKEIKTELWYLDQGFIHSSSLSPQRISGMRIRLHNRALTMLQDEVMKPKPNKSNCKFCFHREQCNYTYEE